MNPRRLSRREVIAGVGGLALSRTFAAPAQAATVSIARCRSYGDECYRTLGSMLDQIGGLGRLVKGKTVALKLNLTGNPTRFPERPDLPYRNHPATVLAIAQLLSKAGAQRIRVIESFFPAEQDLALWARYGLDVQGHQQRGLQGGVGEHAEPRTSQAIQKAESPVGWLYLPGV